MKKGGLLRAVVAVAVIAASATSIAAGPANFTVGPATIHAASFDAGITVLLVSGAAAVINESTGQPTTKFEIDRIPIIHRGDPKAWHNIPPQRWQASLAAFVKSGSPVEISCIGANLLRDDSGKLQAIACLDISADAIKRK